MRVKISDEKVVVMILMELVYMYVAAAATAACAVDNMTILYGLVSVTVR